MTWPCFRRAAVLLCLLAASLCRTTKATGPRPLARVSFRSRGRRRSERDRVIDLQRSTRTGRLTLRTGQVLATGRVRYGRPDQGSLHSRFIRVRKDTSLICLGDPWTDSPGPPILHLQIQRALRKSSARGSVHVGNVLARQCSYGQSM